MSIDHVSTTKLMREMLRGTGLGVVTLDCKAFRHDPDRDGYLVTIAYDGSPKALDAQPYNCVLQVDHQTMNAGPEVYVPFLNSAVAACRREMAARLRARADRMEPK